MCFQTSHSFPASWHSPFLTLQVWVVSCSENVLCCFCVSTLLPSSFSLGRIVSILSLETGCRPATGFSLPCGKVSWTASRFVLPTTSQSTPIVQIVFCHQLFKQIILEVLCFIRFIFSKCFCACHFSSPCNFTTFEETVSRNLSVKKWCDLHSSAASDSGHVG